MVSDENGLLYSGAKGSLAEASDAVPFSDGTNDTSCSNGNGTKLSGSMASTSTYVANSDSLSANHGVMHNQQGTTLKKPQYKMRRLRVPPTHHTNQQTTSTPSVTQQDTTQQKENEGYFCLDNLQHI